MSKAVKKVLTVAAAIAVAYFAPQVSAALLKGSTFASAATATAAKVVTTAAVNAAGNAALAAATGGDVGKAAIAGAITGGIGGYMAGPSGTYPAANAPATAPAAAPVAGGVSAPVTTTTGALTPEIVVTGSRFAPLDVDPSQFFRAGLSSAGVGQPSKPEDLQEVTVTGIRKAGDQYAATPQARLLNQLNSESFGTRAQAALKLAGQEVISKFTNPQAIADLTLRAAGQLAGSAIAGSGLSPAEQKLLAAQAADLEELKRTNQELYNLRLEQAKAILGEAARDYGFETEQRARVATGAQTVAGLRGLTGERRRAEQARLRRGAQEQISTARAQGELMSAENVRQARQAGLAMLPGAGPQAATMTARAGLMDMYGEAERRRQQQAGQVGDFFGSFTGKQQAGLAGFSLDDIEKESKRRRFGDIA